MKNILMKVANLGLSTFFIIVFLLVICCNKQLSFEETIPRPNVPITINNSELIDIRATDVYTVKDSIQRKIEFIDKLNNTVYDVFYITMKSNNFSANIFTQLRNKTFTGTLTIVNNNEVVYTKDMNDSVNPLSSSKLIDNTQSNIVPSCKLAIIHNCVANKINQMSIFEYGMCLVAAPECYAGLWASCGWSSCIVGEQK